ncbi:helix-hairpin-helix domain-containing protein [Chitinophaga sancti]|uniref:Helix-hairpin-helix domain-containing protein n=1 Tax=Chitinophaga sancti TaxID=1004 RepID=A0A1K1REL4_9BACT|nr:helix-hairpin-helix domain-containing protein [Chitinophaga sancti]WQG88718.1 helix-hairpin-helix domain-containing protein [Chitinophaga sancti]SFW70110.1 Helix-hairpin-helix motif-containing protein [Chitinophaga sancti]
MAGLKILILLLLPLLSFARQEDDLVNDDMQWQQLEIYRKQPLSLNNADVVELTSLGLLTSLQIDELVAYKKQFGKLLSIYELQAVPGFDETTIQLILPYVTVAEDPKIIQGEHTFLVRNNLVKYRSSTIGVQLKKDNYSAYYFIKNHRKIKALAIGDFTVNMGQGLINWQAYALGKNGMITHIKREGEIIRGSTSSGVNRGAAITLQHGRLETTAIISVSQIGANIVYKLPQAHLSINWLNQSIGLDYAISLRNYHFFGELAVNHKKAIITGMLASIGKIADLALFYRNYNTAYIPLHANAMAENSRPVNEEGLYTGISIHTLKHWQLDAYADVFHFPWLQYRTTAPADGQELFAALTYTPDKETRLYFRYQFKQKFQQSKSDVFLPPMMKTTHENYRFQLSLSPSKGLTWKMRIEANTWQDENGNQYGGLYQQELVYQLPNWPLRCSLNYIWYSTQGTDTRFYIPDRGVLYDYNLSQLYGKGARQSCTLRWKKGRHLQAWTRLEAGGPVTLQVTYVI